MQSHERLSAVQIPSDLSQDADEPELVTNLRIVSPADGDLLSCTVVRVESAHRGVEILNDCCSRLRRRDRIAAIPWGESAILVLGGHCPKLKPLSGKEWHANFEIDEPKSLDASNTDNIAHIAQLVHIMMTMMFEDTDQYWRQSSSARIWFPQKAEHVAQGIALYRRMSFSTQPLPGVGIGVAMDVRHRFLSEHTVDYYFDPRLSDGEARKRRAMFDRLRQRAAGRKGTLIYDTKYNQSVCYFVSDKVGPTCATTGPIQIGNDHFDSLYDYYRRERPYLDVKPDDTAVFVSFQSKSMTGDKPVAAKLLRISVHLDNDIVPYRMRRKLTIAPMAREKLIEDVWRSLPTDYFERFGFDLSNGNWRPHPTRQLQITPPDLVFADRTLRAPESRSTSAYRDYFRQRRQLLEKQGFLHHEDVGSRDVTVVVPTVGKYWSEELSQAFVKDIQGVIEQLSGRTFNFRIVRADRTEDIVEKLGRSSNGFALIVFNARHRGAYAMLSHDLKRWRKKRFTRQSLERAWRGVQEAHTETEHRRALRLWRDQMFHSAIDVLCQMGGTPWRLQRAPYDACLAVDVSENRRHYGLTLVVNRSDEQFPSFQRVSKVWHKGDHQHETINAELLTDKMGRLLHNINDQLGGFDPLQSLLVLRDGHLCDGEHEAIIEAIEQWSDDGFLSIGAPVDVASFLKSTSKDLRMWTRHGQQCANVLEGTAIQIDPTTSLLCCTGRATLNRFGTADPVLVHAADDTVDIERLCCGAFAYAQLNYSSPAKAMREPLPIKELDTALSERVAQDTRGIQ